MGVPGRGSRGAEAAILVFWSSGLVLATGRLMGVPGCGLRAMSTTLYTLMEKIIFGLPTFLSTSENF